MAENHVIGKDNALLWHIPEDFRHFKRTTMGKPMIMGRKTFESLPGALKGRTHIVISRSGFEHPDAVTAPSLEAAIEMARGIAQNDNQDEVFIIGGGEIYKQSMNIIDRLYLTIVHQDYDGDTQFPEFNRNDWEIVSEEKHEGNPAFTFYTMERKS